MKAWCIQRRYSILFVILIFCIACQCISKSYGFYFPADEFGYWFYAARFAGYEWSDIASLSSYYSYGYSLVLFPVFLICKNGVTAYRVALLANFMLLAMDLFILQKLGDRVSPFCAAAAVFYPTWIFYAGTTFAEILLVTLYIVICRLVLKYLKTDQNSFMALLLIAMFYMYFVHMRAVGVLLSGIVTLVVYDLCNGRKRVKYLLLLMLCAVLLFAVGMMIKKYWTNMIYGGASDELGNASDYVGQIEKLIYIFTPKGFSDLMISVAGKVLYLGLASFGIAYLGIGYTLSRVIRLKADRTNYFYLFVLLSTSAAVMISAIYTVYPGRVDTLAYGRYQEYVMPVLIMAGIRKLREEKQSVKKVVRRIFLILVSEAAMTGLVTVSLRANGQTAFFGNTICGISWLYNPQKFEPVSFYWRAYLAGAALTVFTCMGIWWTGSQRKREVFLVLLVAVQVAAGIRLSAMYMDDSRLGCLRDTYVAQKIQELNPGNKREIFYSTGGESFGNISILQFMMRDTTIHIVKGDFDPGHQSAEDLLLIDYRSSQAQTLEKTHDRHFANGHFILYYNEFD